MSSATARWLWPWKILNSPARAAPAGRLSIFMSPCPVWTATLPNLNTGVMVWRRGLRDPEALERRCLDFLQAHGPKLRYPDQAALNALAQWMRIERPGELAELPRRFNCHPRNPAAVYAPVVHAFGAYKLWNDGLTAACFPEWQRDTPAGCAWAAAPMPGRWTTRPTARVGPSIFCGAL